jgi:hypothetical protein
MQFRLSVLIALCSLLLPLTQAFAQAPPDVPLFIDDFAGTNPLWQPVSGTWSVRGGVSAVLAWRVSPVEHCVPRTAVGGLFPVLADAARQRRPRDPVIRHEATAVSDLGLQHE